MSRHQPPFALRLAASPADLAAAQGLRYRVFVEEMGASGPLVDHRLRLEADRFDAACEHLLLIDALQGRVVGATRLLTEEGAARAGGFAAEEEFDLASLRRSGRRLLEVGRTCLDPAHRGGLGLHALWQGLAGFVRERGVEVLFGLASFPGTDPARHAAALAYLHDAHLAPEPLRPRSLDPAPVPAAPEADRRAAVLGLPPLAKAYLRLGGRVGEGAFVDCRFGCTDLCLVVDVAKPGPLGRTFLAG